jgi:hypothetical protein
MLWKDSTVMDERIRTWKCADFSSLFKLIKDELVDVTGIGNFMFMTQRCA